jgi:hypothetical protein
MLGRTFRLDTSAGFGKWASMRFSSANPGGPSYERPGLGASTPADDSTDPLTTVSTAAQIAIGC